MTKYSVNLIPPNLRKNETIIQIADSLDHLSKVLDDVMLHIEKRVDNYNNKLEKVSNRLHNVESKIGQLKHTKNAIQVFSSSKHPANDIKRNYTSIFPTDTEIPLIRHEVSQKYPLKKDEPIDKLHIYHVKLSKIEPEKIEGLGQVPNDANCISDLILYNSGRNPYKEFSISRSVPLHHASVKPENSKVQIGNAPASIAERSFSNLANQEYFYSPDLGDVPALDVPLDLPDLPGIAGNVRYEEDNNLVIAPSVAFSPTLRSSPLDQKILCDNLEDLPEITLQLPQEIDELQSAIENIDVTEQAIIEPDEIKNEQPSNKIIIEKNKFDKPSKLPEVPDTRASLMEAIRKAGGTKILKSADIKPASIKSETSTGDLMADLHAKLSMRRKGISGAKKDLENSELDSRTALSLMSALIPPPEESNDETDQEDWE
ncbi:WASH complex subunit 1-like [Coccinella septempunctata]|uniref:WASH complex subunit 1-like n=1 Tax=Coccinella septempunctata TaxID=41139 RepID=UPI001D077184|nr:WASH complex subunit 1-like [Coccinella septempunctata]